MEEKLFCNIKPNRSIERDSVETNKEMVREKNARVCFLEAVFILSPPLNYLKLF